MHCPLVRKPVFLFCFGGLEVEGRNGARFLGQSRCSYKAGQHLTTRNCDVGDDLGLGSENVQHILLGGYWDSQAPSDQQMMFCQSVGKTDELSENQQEGHLPVNIPQGSQALHLGCLIITEVLSGFSAGREMKPWRLRIPMGRVTQPGEHPGTCVSAVSRSSVGLGVVFHSPPSVCTRRSDFVILKIFFSKCILPFSRQLIVCKKMKRKQC